MTPCIKLPYKIRNVDQLRKVVSSYVESESQTICFSIEQLVRKIYLCRADSLEIVWRDIEVYDRLSGLKQRLRQPGLKFDKITIWLRWNGTLFVLEASMLQKLVEIGVCAEKTAI